jgi:predicted metal-dependent HD superfamily phosphohydrolase
MITPGRWRDLWRRLEGQTDSEPVFDQLQALYAEPHRAYHNLDHIADCLAQFDRAGHLAVYPAELELAIWLHDIIYDTHASDNEGKSAQWAVDAMHAAHMTPEAIKRVETLILATKHTTAPKEPDAQLLVDIDLSILGRPPREFDAYEAKIRQEYAWVSEDAFRQGRRAILESFLARPSIYQTSFFREQFEAQARENLARSMISLSQIPPLYK